MPAQFKLSIQRQLTIRTAKLLQAFAASENRICLCSILQLVNQILYCHLSKLHQPDNSIIDVIIVSIACNKRSTQ